MDASFLGGARGGDETYLRGMLAGLDHSRSAGDSFPLLVFEADVPELSDLSRSAFPRHVLPRRPSAWHHSVTVPLSVRRLPGLDLLHTVTHAPLVTSVPSVVTVGDLSFEHRPQDYPRRTRLRLRTLVRAHTRTARAVLAPSQFTKADLVATYRLAPEKVHVVPNRVVPFQRPHGADADRARADIDRAGVRPPYLLSVGNLHPRKNVARLVRCFRAARAVRPELSEHQLVVVGGRWWGNDEEREAAGADPAVLFLDRVRDPVRDLLLDGAAALAYLSLFEGFGLPPLEAMAAGVPVLAAAAASLPEVCGDAALLVPPESGDDIVDGIVAILLDGALRRRLVTAGVARAAHYSTQRVGDAARAAFAAALDG